MIVKTDDKDKDNGKAELQIRCVKFTSINTACVISSANIKFGHHYSNKLSNIGFAEEKCIIEIKKYAPYLEPW